MPGGLSMDELSARMAAQSSVRLDKAQVRDAVKAAAEDLIITGNTVKHKMAGSGHGD